MIAFGGGINSVALTVLLIERGWQGHIVFADTGAEKPDTYCYLDYFEQVFLQPRGLSIIRLEPGSKYHPLRSQVPLETFCLEHGVIPLLSIRWCSDSWKIKPLDSWAAEHNMSQRYLGISADEAQRTYGKPENYHYPLVDENINREGCRKIILNAGLEMPLWSSCFFCPGQRIGEWRYVYDHFPDLFERAQRLEYNAKAKSRLRVTLNRYHSLDELVSRGWDAQMSMDLSHWLPCGCRL